MEITPLSGILAKRLALIGLICNNFKAREEKRKIFPRGPLQLEIISTLGLQKTGFTKRAINEALLTFGYRSVFIQGNRFYSKRK